LPTLPLVEVALFGERLSIVRVLELVSLPDCELVLVKLETVADNAYDPPGTADMLACDLGVMRILNWVALVVTGMGVPPEKFTMLLLGLVAAEKYVVLPSSEVILTSDTPSYGVPEPARVTVRAMTESVPVLVARVKDPASRMLAPGPTLAVEASVPVAIVVTGSTGVNGDPLKVTPSS
jgi:hypothetical protein